MELPDAHISEKSPTNKITRTDMALSQNVDVSTHSMRAGRLQCE